MKGLNYFQACDLWLQGKALRRAAWHRWITWEHWLGWITQPAVDGLDPFKRVALGTDFTSAEYNAADFTDEPWDAAFPAPIVEPSTGADSSHGSAGGSHGNASGPPSALWGQGLGGGGGGSPGHPVPHDPPAGNPAVITITYQSDLVPAGPSCLLPDQYAGQTCTVTMTVAVTGGPAGVFGLHIQLGTESKPAENGYNGYTRDFSVTAAVNPGASLTPNVIYHATGGDVTQHTPAFAFPPACKLAAFNGNGAGGFMAVQGGNAPAALNANTFTRDGFTFAGWNTVADGSGTAYADRATYAFAADVSLCAQWTALPEHTVTFAPNGTAGSMDPQTGNVPAALNANTFTRSGYTFANWNTAADGSGTPYADGATYDFAADLALYARWTPEPHTVTFAANGGSGSMDPQTGSAPAALTANAFTRDGYTFANWNTAADGTGTAYADGASYDFSADLALYARWTAESHTVTFAAHGGSGSMAAQHSSVPVALTANAFTREGYDFAGWNTLADGTGTGYADGATYGFDSDLALSAQWTALPPPEHTVTFLGNGSDGGSMSPQMSAAPAALAANAFSLTGSAFAGWNTAADGTGTAYADGASYAFDADLTLYAQWM